MGFWGSTLYANDCTSDVRDCYKKYLQEGMNNEDAYQKVLQSFSDHMGTEEEPLVWYALADTQWKFGRLLPEVKATALWWIEQGGGMEFWESSANQGVGWKKTLANLNDQLHTPQPPEKKIRKPTHFKKNPWNIGDVYAYQFHTDEAKEKGYFGKYILLQKLEDNSFFGDTLNAVRVFSGVYDHLPVTFDEENANILPLDNPNRFMPSGRNVDFPKLRLCAVLSMERKSFYPKEHLTYICNAPVPEKLYNRITWGFLFAWSWFERDMLYFHPMWKEYDYELLENETVVRKNSSADVL